jgi:hypothetical protein
MKIDLASYVGSQITAWLVAAGTVFATWVIHRLYERKLLDFLRSRLLSRYR